MCTYTSEAQKIPITLLQSTLDNWSPDKCNFCLAEPISATPLHLLQ